MKTFSADYICSMMAILILLALIPDAYSQSPTFEVASVKKSPPASSIRVVCKGGPSTNDPIRWMCENMSLSELISTAFGLPYHQLQAPFPLDDGRSKLDAERFNINAKVPEGATKDQFLQMQRNLLIERFGLKFHLEQKEMDGYELVIAKNGPKFKESEPERTSPDTTKQAGSKAEKKDKYGFPLGMDYQMGQVGMDGGTVRKVWARTKTEKIAAFISDQIGKPVADSTGLKAEYALSLEWTYLPEAESITGFPPNLFTALQEQLGLKLQPKKIVIEILIIDHVERIPTEN
jgi:uncharacterized protein (TIGR03435 family)